MQFRPFDRTDHESKEVLEDDYDDPALESSREESIFKIPKLVANIMKATNKDYRTIIKTPLAPLLMVFNFWETDESVQSTGPEVPIEASFNQALLLGPMEEWEDDPI